MKSSLTTILFASPFIFATAVYGQSTVPVPPATADANGPVQQAAAGAPAPNPTQPVVMYQPGPSDAAVGPYDQAEPVFVESIGMSRARAANSAGFGTMVGYAAGPGQAEAGISAALGVLRNSGSPDRILAANALAGQIQSAPYGSHAQFGVYELRVRAATATFNSEQNRSVQFAGDAAANGNISQARQRLEASLDAAENASPDQWDSARATLAQDYRDYARALAQAGAR